MKKLIHLYQQYPVFSLAVKVLALFAWAITMIFLIVILSIACIH